MPSGCHFIAHVIAEEAVVKNPKSWETVAKALPLNECTGGFIMGSIEGKKLTDSNFTLNETTIPIFCSDLQQTVKQSVDTCVHTTGHLLLIESSRDVHRAIDTCSRLTPNYRYECFAGVFMENLFRRNLAAHGIGKPLVWNEQTIVDQTDVCKSHSGLIA